MKDSTGEHNTGGKENWGTAGTSSSCASAHLSHNVLNQFYWCCSYMWPSYQWPSYMWLVITTCDHLRLCSTIPLSASSATDCSSHHELLQCLSSYYMTKNCSLKTKHSFYKTDILGSINAGIYRIIESTMKTTLRSKNQETSWPVWGRIEWASAVTTCWGRSWQGSLNTCGQMVWWAVTLSTN